MRREGIRLAWLWLSPALALAALILPPPGSCSFGGGSFGGGSFGTGLLGTGSAASRLAFAPAAFAKGAQATRQHGAFSLAVPASGQRIGLSVAFEPKQRTVTLRALGQDEVLAYVIQLPELASTVASSELVRLAGGENALVLRFGDETPYVLVLLPPRVDAPAALEGAVVLKGLLGGPAATQASLDVVLGPEGQRLILSEATDGSGGLCGRRARATRALDPKRGRFVRVAVPVLGAEERRKASKLVARSDTATGTTGFSDLYLGPLPSAFETEELELPVLTDARFAEGASPYEVVDVSPSAERRLEALVVRTLAAPVATDASWDLWLITVGGVIEVDTSGVRGAPTFVIELPEQLRSGCLGLAVGVGAPLSEVTGRLAAVPAPSSLGAALQADDGDRWLRQLALVRPSVVPELGRAYRSLHPLARARAEALARLSEPNDAEQFWVRQLVDGSDGEQARARARLQNRADGGTAALSRALRQASARDEATLARALAEVSPASALRPIASRLGQRSPARRLELRRVLAELEKEPAFLDEVSRFLLDQSVVRAQKVEVVRAIVPVIPRLEAHARQGIVLLLQAASLDELYVLVPAALELSLGTPAAREVLQGWLGGERKGASDRELAALRTEVLGSARDRELSAAWISELAGSLLLDPFVRVRIAAASYLELAPRAEASAALQDRLRHDDWPGMRGATLGALSSLRGDPAQGAGATSAMIRALAKDEAPSVRARAARSLDRLPGEDTLGALRRSLGKDESAAVRAEAARTLGLLCDRESTEALTAAARGLSRGARDEADVRLGLYAVTALVRLGPADLDKRLEPLTAKSVPGPLRARVESAIVAGRGGCATASQQ